MWCNCCKSSARMRGMYVVLVVSAFIVSRSKAELINGNCLEWFIFIKRSIENDLSKTSDNFLTLDKATRVIPQHFSLLPKSMTAVSKVFP